MPSEMLSSLVKGQKQLSTVQSNKARLVIKIRWIVKSVNSQLKQWKSYEKVKPNVHLSYLHEYLQIIRLSINIIKVSLKRKIIWKTYQSQLKC